MIMKSASDLTAAEVVGMTGGNLSRTGSIIMKSAPHLAVVEVVSMTGGGFALTRLETIFRNAAMITRSITNN